MADAVVAEQIKETDPALIRSQKKKDEEQKAIFTQTEGKDKKKKLKYLTDEKIEIVPSVDMNNIRKEKHILVRTFVRELADGSKKKVIKRRVLCVKKAASIPGQKGMRVVSGRDYNMKKGEEKKGD